MTLPTTSNWFKKWMIDVLGQQTTGGIDFINTAAGDFRLVLFRDAGTYSGYNFDTDTAYPSGVWSTTNEVQTGGGYTLSGLPLAAITSLNISAANTVTWGAGASVSWGGSTIAAEGCVVHATVPTNLKYLLAFTKFAGAPSSSNGTFSVTYTSGIISWT